MGDLNQFYFVLKNKNLVKEPILEIGSKDYWNTQNFRSIFPNFEYIGVDMEDGKGVDVIIDFTDDLDIIKNKLNKKKFNTIFCFSVLEHCKNPFKMCENITNILEKNGFIFIGVPFTWRIHSYPSDYWRFTSEGIKILFSNFDFKHYDNNISSRINEIRKISKKMFQIYSWDSRSNKNIINRIIIFLLRKIKNFPPVFEYPYLFPPVMINMIGKKKS